MFSSWTFSHVLEPNVVPKNGSIHVNTKEKSNALKSDNKSHPPKKNKKIRRISNDYKRIMNGPLTSYVASLKTLIHFIIREK